MFVIDIYGKDSSEPGRQTVFAISPDRLATVCHGLIGAERITLSLPDRDAVDLKMWSSDPESDVAILIGAIPATAVPLGLSTERANPGDTVVILRSQVADTAGGSGGIIVSKSTHPIYGPQYLTTCECRAGDSGAPIVNARGEVVGVVASIVSIGGKQLVRACPSERLRDVNAEGHPQVLSEWNVGKQFVEFGATRRARFEAQDALARGDDEIATRLLKGVVETTPRDFRSWYLLLGLLSESGRPNQVGELSRGWETAAVRPDLLDLARGYAFIQMAKPDVALNLFERSQAARPSSLALIHAAAAKLLLGRSSDAQANLRQAAVLDPDDPLPWKILTDLLRRSQQFADAADAGERWAAREWTDESSVALGMALGRMRENQRAERAFEEALRRNPQSPRAHAGIGSLRMLAGQDAEAVISFETAHRLDPSDNGISLTLAQAYRKAKRFPEAIGVLETLTADQAVKVEALKRLIICARESHDEVVERSARDRLRLADPVEYKRLETLDRNK